MDRLGDQGHNDDKRNEECHEGAYQDLDDAEDHQTCRPISRVVEVH